MARKLLIKYYIHRDEKGNGCGAYDLVAPDAYDRKAPEHDLMDHDSESGLDPYKEEVASLGAYWYREQHYKNCPFVGTMDKAVSGALIHWRRAGKPIWFFEDVCVSGLLDEDEDCLWADIRDCTKTQMEKMDEYETNTCSAIACLIVLGRFRLAREFTPEEMPRAITLGKAAAGLIQFLTTSLYHLGCELSEIEIRLSRKEGAILEVLNPHYSHCTVHMPFELKTCKEEWIGDD